MLVNLKTDLTRPERSLLQNIATSADFWCSQMYCCALTDVLSPQKHARRKVQYFWCLTKIEINPNSANCIYIYSDWHLYVRFGFWSSLEHFYSRGQASGWGHARLAGEDMSRHAGHHNWWWEKKYELTMAGVVLTGTAPSDKKSCTLSSHIPRTADRDHFIISKQNIHLDFTLHSLSFTSFDGLSLPRLFYPYH